MPSLGTSSQPRGFVVPIEGPRTKSIPLFWSASLKLAEGVAPRLVINDIPCTMKGAAVHNISNGLGVVGLAKALNFDTNTIVQALTSFQSNASDNPGRDNLLDVGYRC